jgi:cyanate permease
MYTPNCMIFYFCITWLPSYLKAHGLGPVAQAFGSGLPLFLSMPGDLAGGWLTDWLSARYGLKVGRCGLGSWAYLAAGAALVGAALVASPVTAAVLIALATGVTMFTLGAAWGTVIDVGRNNVGVVGATMNSTGNLVAMLNPLIVGYSVQWFNSWNLPLYVMGVLFFVGAICWRMIDPKKPVIEEEAAGIYNLQFEIQR